MWTRIMHALFGYPPPTFAQQIDDLLADFGIQETYDWTDDTMDGGEL